MERIERKNDFFESIEMRAAVALGGNIRITCHAVIIILLAATAADAGRLIVKVCFAIPHE